MAAANNGPRFTRSRKTTTPDDPTEKPAYAPQPRSLRSRKTAPTGIVLKDNCVVVIPKLQSKITKNTEQAERQSPARARKRTRVDNGDESRDENDKRTRLMAQKTTETGERTSSRKEKEAQSTSKQRTAKRSVVLTEESQDSSTLSEVESEDHESSSDSKSESGMVSGGDDYSSSSSSTSHRESDSPVPTSELSDSSDGIESSSDESSSSEDVLRWRTRKSPRKLAQAKSRGKIAELCKPESDDTLSPSSSDSSYSE